MCVLSVGEQISDVVEQFFHCGVSTQTLHPLLLSLMLTVPHLGCVLTNNFQKTHVHIQHHMQHKTFMLDDHAPRISKP